MSIPEQNYSSKNIHNFSRNFLFADMGVFEVDLIQVSGPIYLVKSEIDFIRSKANGWTCSITNLF